MVSKDSLLHNSVLHLILGQLTQLAQGHFFSNDLQSYIGQLQKVLLQLADTESEKTPILPEAKRLVTDAVWRATQYLAGSTSNRIPYEIVYSLKHALEDWGVRDCVITTSLLKSSDFSCERINSAPAKICAELMLKTEFSVDLVQVAFPEIFEHSPIFCTPLYHEIGHYVEERYQRITGMATHAEDLIEHLPDHPYLNINYSEQSHREIFRDHSIEHFCDIFAASYVGECAAFYIEQWAPDQPFTVTHPSTQSRVELIHAFLEERSSPYLDALLETSKDSEGNSMLKRRFILPAVEAFYADIRPCEIQSVEELHGVFPASLAFMQTPGFPAPPLAPMNNEKVAATINGLAEKSIRNFMIKRAWNEHLDKIKN